MLLVVLKDRRRLIIEYGDVGGNDEDDKESWVSNEDFPGEGGGVR